MKVGEAQPGQILYAKGRVPKSYTKNLGQQELEVCRQAGFLPGFLMPAWLGKELKHHSTIFNRERDFDKVTALFYLGAVRLPVPVGGLKKHHLFLYEGEKIALEGYDFRHLSLLETM